MGRGAQSAPPQQFAPLGDFHPEYWSWDLAEPVPQIRYRTTTSSGNRNSLLKILDARPIAVANVLTNLDQEDVLALFQMADERTVEAAELPFGLFSLAEFALKADREGFSGK